MWTLVGANSQPGDARLVSGRDEVCGRCILKRPVRDPLG